MSRIAIIAIITLTGLAGFGLGYWAGYVPPPVLELQPLPPQASDEELEPIAQEVADVLSIVDPLERTEKLAALLRTLGPESITAVRQGYDTVFLDIRATELRLLAEWWTQHDPHSAFRWTQVHWTGSSVLNEVMRAWAARDPQSAKAALGMIAAHPGQMRRLVESVAVGWDESRQPGLAEFLREMPPGPQRQTLLTSLMRRRVLRDGPEATIEWIVALPPDDPPDRFKLQCFRRTATALTKLDPQQGADFAAKYGEEEYGRGLYRRVATTWGVKDGEATLAWLKTLPAGPERDDGVREAFVSWARTRNEDAHAWIAAQPIEAWNEPARSIHARRLARSDRDAGFALAATLTNTELRHETEEIIARRWMAEDPEAAKAWLEQSDLGEVAKRRVIQRPLGGPGRPARGE